ncbi:hypothetical protein [Shewanella waksmanii]|uniref:hypothetical protein n=1 Tax=Shewanella waksmanii TaxID=213783 RepID=UPI0037362755
MQTMILLAVFSITWGSVGWSASVIVTLLLGEAYALLASVTIFSCWIGNVVKILDFFGQKQRL